MKRSRWIVAALYVATIYLTIPYTSRVWLDLSARTRLSPSTMSVIILSAASLLLLAVLLRRGLSLRSGGALLLLAGVYALLLRIAFIEPIERLHLIEYGVLPCLLWWAMGSRLTWQTLAAVWVLSADVGVFDELIQHFTPGRFGEVRDVVINWEAVTLGLALIVVVRRQTSDKVDC